MAADAALVLGDERNGERASTPQIVDQLSVLRTTERLTDDDPYRGMVAGPFGTYSYRGLYHV